MVFFRPYDHFGIPFNKNGSNPGASSKTLHQERIKPRGKQQDVILFPSSDQLLTMGPQSQSTLGSVKKCKQHAIPRKQKQMRRDVQARVRGQQQLSDFFQDNAAFFPLMNLKSKATKSTATNLNDAWRKIKCKACRYNAKYFPKKCHKAHDEGCEHMALKRKRKAETKLFRNEFNKNLTMNNAPLQPHEKASGRPTAEDMNLFFAKRQRKEPPPSSTRTPSPDPPGHQLGGTGPSPDPPGSRYANDRRVLTAERLSYQAIQNALTTRMEKPTSKMTRGNNKVLPQVKAVADYILDMFPTRSPTEEGLGNYGELGTMQINAYRLLFPPGTLAFTIPPSDKSMKPDFNYSLIEGVAIYFTDWGLNIPDFKSFKCPCEDCNDGLMKRGFWDFATHGVLTPIQHVDGSTAYSINRQYKCNKCGFTCKANDGRLFHQLPSYYRRAYPVDPRYAVNYQIHLSKSASQLVEKLMLTYGNGEQISRALHEMSAARYENFEEDYYRRYADWREKTKSTEAAPRLPSFRDYFGNRMGLKGDTMRDRYGFAASSNLTATNLSDDMRNTREIQAVGCRICSSSDHTFAIIKNYIADEIGSAKAVHTINTETAEIASAAIVDTTSAKDFAHQLEQFSRRPNVCPKVHVTDNCPANDLLLRELFDRDNWKIVLRLGMFHWMHRISVTLNDQHPDCNAAIAELSKCIYTEDLGDTKEVKAALLDGRLGPRPKKGEKKSQLTEDDVHLMQVTSTSLWKSYRNKYIRIWIKPQEEIEKNLQKWFEKYKRGVWPYDPKTGADLFMVDTESAVERARNSVPWVTDVLPKEDIYEPIAPGRRSKTDLPEYLGKRGVESKLESFHLRLAHFGNLGTSKELMDSLCLAGMAEWNKRIRHRHRCLRDPTEALTSWSKEVPSHLDHSYLALINNLARQAGVADDAHKNVMPLPKDNGERFMSMYWDEQQKRNSNFVPKASGRCMCHLCIPQFRENPYASQIGRYEITERKRKRVDKAAMEEGLHPEEELRPEPPLLTSAFQGVLVPKPPPKLMMPMPTPALVTPAIAIVRQNQLLTLQNQQQKQALHYMGMLLMQKGVQLPMALKKEK